MRRTSAAAGLAGVLTILTLSSAGGTAIGGDHPEHGAEFGPWTVAVNLGPIVNSQFVDGGPGISRDGLALYFHSTRQSAGSELDLYVTRRAAIDLPWEAPVNLGAIVNSLASDFVPTLSRDGRHLFFASQRSGNADIYVSHRSDVDDDLAWETPVALPAPVNGPSFDAGVAYFEPPHRRPQLYFASDRAHGGGQAGTDIYVAELLSDGTWSEPAFVAEVNSAFQDGRPTLSADGLEMVFNSTRDGSNALFAARRRHAWEPWSTPEKIGAPVNSGTNEMQAVLAANGRTLYFTSGRPGGIGANDLYVSTRARLRSEHD